MVKIVTVAEMRAIEEEADASGLSYAQMMDNAGRALADRVLALLEEQPRARITVLVGPGNNGGDALVGGRLIAAESEHEVNFYLYRSRDEKKDPNFAAVKEAGLFIAEAENDQRYRVLKNLINTSHVIIDGLLGIGLKLPLKGELAKFMDAALKAIQAARQAPPPLTYQTPADPATWPGSGPYIVAVDCPSGLDCDTGEVDPLTIPADETVTFAAVKRGQIHFPGAALVGQLHVADIGLPQKLPSRDAISLELLTGAEARALLPALPLDAHKGTFGKAMIVAGSLNYTGAAAMAAKAAYRAGAGLVTVGAPQPIVPILASQVPEATWLLLPHDLGVLDEKATEVLQKELDGYSALLMGPGWGREETTRNFLRAMLSREEREHVRRQIGFVPSTPEGAASREDNALQLPPLVIDADGLNLLSQLDAWWELLPPETILTPHPGEMSRLTGLSSQEIQASRLELAAQKAQEWNCIVLLKGAYTVIAAPDGRVAVLPFAEPALATAGTGDVLAGTIVGALAQGLAPFDAARLGGFLHGLAGAYASEAVGSARSVTAKDVLDALPDAMTAIEQAA